MLNRLFILLISTVLLSSGCTPSHKPIKCGCGPSEVAGMRAKQKQYQEDQVRIHKGKGN